jgi:hypothetical protein
MIPEYEDPIITTLKLAGIPVTRANYINLAHNPDDGEWSAELEATLPEHLQDWELIRRQG